MNVVVLSALYGAYEWPKPVPQQLGVPAVMMTDEDLPESGWEYRKVRPGIVTEFPDPAATVGMMRHKYWKCHPHLAVPDADVVIWVDASISILVDDFVDRCLEALGDDDWAVVPHPARGCIYDEASFSGHLARYDRGSLDIQAQFYSLWHPPNWGLFATGFSVRRLTPLVQEIGEQWWWECSTRTHQDQVSLPVLFRLAEEKGLKWNRNLPWGDWWGLAPHGR